MLLDLDELSRSWLLELAVARRSPATIKVYRNAWAAYAAFCRERAESVNVELTKPQVLAFLAEQTARCSAPTASLRLTALKVFASWLAAEEDFDATAVLSVCAPRCDERVIDHLTDQQVSALLAACAGREFRDVRDTALVSLFIETGLRASECLGLSVADVSVTDCVALVRKGKGAKERRVRFSSSAAVAIDRYLRARRREYVHGVKAFTSSSDPLWLSSRGPLSYRGLAEALRTRAITAGIKDFHLHRLRHTCSVRWLRRGGSETGLMAQCGWQSRTMIDRYTRSAREDIAADEFDRLHLGIGEL